MTTDAVVVSGKYILCKIKFIFVMHLIHKEKKNTYITTISFKQKFAIYTNYLYLESEMKNKF